ncbi:protein RD3-like [Ochotona princeps]|uniref:protein RD3-like n=1 Tax=Ochotona princeps TaxID=9978 RepID=UPI002714D99F|nr:protein RD3-like [Ochotona princeps]
MPLFDWMKWPKTAAVKAGSQVATQTLLQELTRHVRERKRFIQDIEDEQNVSRAGTDHSRLQSCQTPQASIPATEQRQPEALCARVQPGQTTAVLSRFREILAENDALPCKVVYIFKQVLKDSVSGAQRGDKAWGQAAGPRSACRTGCPPVPLAAPGEGAWGPGGQEIPTISSYVDRNSHSRFPALTHGIWNPPH